MPYMQQQKRKLSLPNSTPPEPTLLGMQTHVETSRNQIQGNRPDVNPWSGANPTPGHMRLDSTAQRQCVMDGITEMACFLRKNRDLSIGNSLRLIECTLAPLPAFSGPVIIWPEKKFKRLTAAFVLCNKEARQMAPNTSMALFTFPKDQRGLQIQMPKAIICPAVWGHLTCCCQFDDGTRQLAEITCQDALKNTDAWTWSTLNLKRNS